MEGFLHYRFVGLIFGGAYTWRGLFSEFYVFFFFGGGGGNLWFVAYVRGVSFG